MNVTHRERVGIHIHTTEVIQKLARLIRFRPTSQQLNKSLIKSLYFWFLCRWGTQKVRGDTGRTNMRGWWSGDHSGPDTASGVTRAAWSCLSGAMSGESRSGERGQTNYAETLKTRQSISGSNCLTALRIHLRRRARRMLEDYLKTAWNNTALFAYYHAREIR